MDAIAAKVGIDRIEVRRRNLIDKAAMPYDVQVDTLGTHVVYDSGDYARLLDKAAQGRDLGRDAARLRTAPRRRREGRRRLRHVRREERARPVRQGADRDRRAAATIEVVTGAASVGQGIETVMAQICADTLGVDYAKLKVIHGQTDRIDNGMGAFASRVTVMCGEATRLAALKLREQALAMASQLMQTPADQLDIAGGEIVRRGKTGPSHVADCRSPRTRPDGLSAEAEFNSTHMIYPYGAHVAQVKRRCRDRRRRRSSATCVAYDVGRAVNPMLVEGQIVGGVAQGIGGALLRGVPLRRERRAALASRSPTT